MSAWRGQATTMIDPAVIQELRLLQEEADPELLSALVGIYLKTTPLRLDRLLEAISAKDSLKVASVAHDLKSSSANLGVVAIRDLSFVVEASAKAEDWEALMKLHAQLEHHYNAAQTELGRILAEG